jgi:L-alanine-DL-glutamate epimerase-like enolase superfamily enzyme
VRAAAGPDLVIRIDANGAWSEDQAPRALRELEPVGIELCEEPASGIAAVARVSAATNVPIAIDETAEAPGALERRVCAAACLKIVRCGGVSGLLEAARRARTAGYQIYLASMLDGPLGIAAALHAAAAVGPERPSGLATLGRFEDQPDVLRAREGRIAVPSGPGLGEGLEWWYGGD